MKMASKVDIVITSYNHGKFLEEAIRSILNQTYRNFHIIIVDDCSTDNSKEIINQYNKKYPDEFTVIFNKKNMGISASLNRALEQCNKEYVAFQASDDLSLPQRLEKQVNFLNKNKNIMLLGSWFQVISEDGKPLFVRKVLSRNDEIKKSLLKGIQFGAGTIMLRRECLSKVGLNREETGLAHDHDLWLRISEKYDVANIPEVLYKYRLGSQAVSVKRRIEQIAYGKFVQELAKERRKYGKDRLQTLSKKEIDKILNDTFSKVTQNEKKALAYNYFYRADILYSAGDYLTAKEWLLKAIDNNFFDIKNWILFLKIIINLTLPTKVTERLKSVRHFLNLFK